MKKLIFVLLGLLPALSFAGVTKSATSSASSSIAPAVSPVSVSGPGLLAPSALAPSLLSPALAAPAPAPMPAAAAPSALAHVIPAAIAPVDGHPRAALFERLHRRFAALDAAFPIPARSPAARLRRHVRAELLDTVRTVPEADASLLETVAGEADRALAAIQKRLDAGEIDPSLDLRVDPDGPPVSSPARPLKVGVYPVAADPFHWGHLIVALRAVGDLSVDKVVFVLAGDDPRKPTMTPVLDRHPMGVEVLKGFAPFFVYSPIAVGTQFDGETNIFRILALNPGMPVEAWYMVGDDHYRLTDKKGNPDTLPKLEANREKALGHDTALHQLKVAFIERERPAESVPTTLEVKFIEHAGFDASSTAVREGSHGLVPHRAIEYARRRGLYGMAEPPSPVK
ncbi:MAG: hypothetical protein HYV14_04770 [Elusimicrobia bacterium]|nr:hypothetical protein [Elusimicrobiota bacterium]